MFSSRFVRIGTVASAAFLGSYMTSHQMLPFPMISNAAAAASPAAAAVQPVKPLKAICVLTPDNNSNVSGIVRFSQIPGSKTQITAQVKGLTDGCHGFHIHTLGNLSKGCTSAGGHFNPFNREHGGPKDENRHVGDLGNLHSENGNAMMIAEEFSLVELAGVNSIIGRSIIVHESKDCLGRGGFPDSKTTGHAGGRLACGVIGIDE